MKMPTCLTGRFAAFEILVAMCCLTLLGVPRQALADEEKKPSAGDPPAAAQPDKPAEPVAPEATKPKAKPARKRPAKPAEGAAKPTEKGAEEKPAKADPKPAAAKPATPDAQKPAASDPHPAPARPKVRVHTPGEATTPEAAPAQPAPAKPAPARQAPPKSDRDRLSPSMRAAIEAAEREAAAAHQAEEATPTQAAEPAPAAGAAPEQPAAPMTYRPAPREDRLAELLAGVDPSMLTLSGAEIEVQVVDDKLIVRGNEEDVARIQLLMTLLDESRSSKELRVVTVTQQDANEIADRLQPALRETLATANQREEDQLSITALSSTVLLVSALPSDIEFVVDVIGRVDATQDEIGKIETMSFQVEHRKASQVALKLEEILIQMQDRRGVPAAKRIQIRPNSVNNTILVIAPLTDRETIEALVRELDVAADPSWSEVRLAYFPLLRSEAEVMATTITDLIESLRESDAAQEDAEEAIQRMLMSRVGPDGAVVDLEPISLEKKLSITPHEGTNSLIVATVEENIRPLGELIRLLDGVALEEAMHARIFALNYADATTVVELLEGMFESGKDLPEEVDNVNAGGVPENDTGRALVYNIGLSADARTNTMIATGRKEQLNLVADLVYQLDQPARDVKFPLKLVQLKHIDVGRAMTLVRSVMDKRLEALEALSPGAGAVERERVFLSIDMRTNAMIIAASDDNYAEVIDILAQIDAPGDAKLFETVRIISCGRLSAADLKEQIDSLWERKAAIRGDLELPEDAPIVVAEGRSNSLLVASSIEDFEEMRHLVTSLDAQPLVDDTRLFKIEFADAAGMAERLRELFEGLSGSRENFRVPTIIADSRSNTLLVAADHEAMERTSSLIQRLDVKAGPQSARIETYPLRYASVAALQPKMQQLFDARAEGQDGERTPLVLIADEASNSLITSASADDQDVVVELLGLLDKPSELSRSFEIFPLTSARASQVATKMSELFAAQAEGGSGRVDAIAAVPDERTNSIIVWASPSQMADVARMVAKLDTVRSGVERMVKVIQLKQALADDFATILQETLIGDAAGSDDEEALIVSFWQEYDDGSRELRKLLRQDIKITPDPRTNSLMVMAPAESMDMLEALIRDFDRFRPVNSELRLFPLINSDAEAMVDQLTTMFEAPSGGGEGQTRTQFNLGGEFSDLEAARVGQDLRFSADVRTNTIIAAGAEVDLRMVEELVRYLDAQDVEDRVTDVVRAKYNDAQQIATAVRSFIESEQSIYGELDDATSQMRRAQRQISVESLGEEGKSGLLLVGSSRQKYASTMELISQLDRPEPQVSISVLIAEVTLTNDIELGVELAGQQLRFSEQAVLGPNGIIQGPGFDVVGGTSIGAVGSGQGFNFTVTGEDFGFLIHALQQDSRTEILSRPLLTVRNGEEGRISISDNIPFAGTSQITESGSTNVTIQREDVGIILTATPQISPDGYVTIALLQEVSNFSGENLQISEGVTSPIISTREVETNVTVRDGETVVIGGLITSRDSDGTSKVPLLGDLPYLGPFFRTTSRSQQKTELLVVLTVDVLTSDEDIRNMSIEQRDKFVLPDSVRQSPLMEGLRIRPGETPMGPREDGEPSMSPGPAAVPPDDRNRQFGPKPRIYGPTIGTPTSTTASAAAAPTFGPRVVKVSEPPTEAVSVVPTDVP